jgi:hypothetical protein
MPQFNQLLTTPQGDMAARRAKAKLSKKSNHPIEVIGEGANFSWGYNGKYYYVTEGVFDHLVTCTHLSLEEAKRLYESLVFTESIEPCSKLISQTIKNSRKEKLNGDDLMWFFVDALETTKMKDATLQQ